MEMSLPEWLEQDSFDLEVAQEETLLDATEELYNALIESKISKKELAEKLGKKPAFISKLFRGSHNPTLKTLAEVAYALNKRVRVKLVDEVTAKSWHSNNFDTDSKVVRVKKMYSHAANADQIKDRVWS
ncbi:helix-turn-helix transcriptional regulator [Marinomonas sp. M1K-6]|uniref:Helix-turn-helix transcriptional regulator n=1 Tax=Marinomonas profundi TaxID=2726122 RepID=A0A847R899_9GAMM|nr:helix-turn-helix transcriptional regulator [Marinomonas profundi]NLQ17397.1 helix-turn-helix transcriptional regulator [Marinomonas profundi]UDV01923.1 helix-turn-helix transcriptional regulator [Marinomonas profundi]